MSSRSLRALIALLASLKFCLNWDGSVPEWGKTIVNLEVPKKVEQVPNLKEKEDKPPQVSKKQPTKQVVVQKKVKVVPKAKATLPTKKVQPQEDEDIEIPDRKDYSQDP